MCCSVSPVMDQRSCVLNDWYSSSRPSAASAPTSCFVNVAINSSRNSCAIAAAASQSGRTKCGWLLPVCQASSSFDFHQSRVPRLVRKFADLFSASIPNAVPESVPDQTPPHKMAHGLAIGTLNALLQLVDEGARCREGLVGLALEPC